MRMVSGNGLFLLKNKWEWVEFVEKWVELGCFCSNWVGVGRFSSKMAGRGTFLLKNGWEWVGVFFN